MSMLFSNNSDKGRELSEAQAEIKALRLSERAREKAVEEVFFFCQVCFNERWKVANLGRLAYKISF